MTQQCLEILNRGGYCSEKDMDILLSELPYLRRTDYGFDNGMHGYRHYIRFYLHNVRGYCYIYDTYNLYEGSLTDGSKGSVNCPRALTFRYQMVNVGHCIKIKMQLL